MKKILLPFLVLGLLCLGTRATAQQWFIKQWNTEQFPVSQPNYDPGGSFKGEGNNSDVILYGTIGFSESAMTGGFGQADVLINKNDASGNPIWGLTVGTAANDHVSRVIEDRFGNLVVLIHREEGGVVDAYVLTILVSQSGGSYTFSIGKELMRKKSHLYDMVEVYNLAGNVSLGYAILGYEDVEKRSFLLKLDHNLTMPNSQFWQKYIDPTENNAESVELFSIKQELSPQENRKFTNQLILCGTIKIGFRDIAYALKVNHRNAIWMDDFNAWNFVDDPVCDLYGSWQTDFPAKFTEVICTRDGGVLFLGSTRLGHLEPSEVILVNTTLNFDQVNWYSRVLWPGHREENLPLDLFETDLTYGVVMGNTEFSPRSEYAFTHFLKDGTYHDSYTLIGSNESGIQHTIKDGGSFDPEVQMLWKDYALDCDNTLHIPGVVDGPVPTGFSVAANYYVIHAATKLYNYEGECISRHMDGERIGFCNTVDRYNPQVGYAWLSSNFKMSDSQAYSLSQPDPVFDEVCASTCTEGLCDALKTLVDVCPEDLTSGFTLTLPPSAPATSVLWFDGSTGTSTTVATANPEPVYYAAVTDASGCVSLYAFVINVLPDLTYNRTISGISCRGGDDGDICFQTSIDVASVSVTYTLTATGQNLFATGSPNSSIFCVADIIGTTGLQMGTYSVVMTDINGCQTIAQTVNLVDPPLLQATVTVTNATSASICDGSIDVTPSGGTPTYDVQVIGFSYNVTQTGVTGTATFSGLCDGIFAINVTDAAGCIEQDTVWVDTGMNKWSNRPDASVLTQTPIQLNYYPNPVSVGGELNITTNAATTLTMTDATGKLVKTMTLPASGTHQFQLQGLPGGLYLLRDQTGSWHRKLIVQ